LTYGDFAMSILNHPNDRQALILFMRQPQAGQVKTRLAATHGDQFALELYVKLLRRTLGVCLTFQQGRPNVDLLVFATPAVAIPEIARDFPGPWRLLPQTDGHLGRRMDQAFATCRQLGYRRTVLVGTDLCDLDATDLEAAFAELVRAPVVLGPAADGGFYLVGLRPVSHLAFHPKTWGTSSVYARTRAAFGAAGLIVRSLAVRHDLDTAADLARIQHDPMFTGRVSVIVPTRRRPEQVQPFLDRIRTGLWPGDEILLVHPAAPGPVQPPPAACDHLHRTIRVLPSALGRGRQLNAGAGAATGDLLWFLHDDCQPPAGFGYHPHRFAARTDQALGCFRLAFEPSCPELDLIAAWANLRTRIRHRPYGDQGLFCRRRIYDQIGGFQRPMLMEDVEFVRRALTLGGLTIIDEPIRTAPSRYLERGIWRASLQNHLLMLLHALGIDDATLYRLYYGRSPAKG